MELPGRIAMIEHLLKTEPDDVFLNYALALELSNDEATRSQGLDQYFKVLKLDPEYVPAYYQLGKFYEAEGKNPEAIDILKKGLVFAREKKDLKSVNEFEEAIFLLED